MGSLRNACKTILVTTLMLAIVAGSLVLPAYTKEVGSHATEGLRSTFRSPVSTADGPTHARLNDAYGKLPLSFELNQGQFDSRVKFVCRADGHTIFLTALDAVLLLDGPNDAAQDQNAVANQQGFLDRQAEQHSQRSTVLRMKLIGAKPARVEGLDEMPGTSNYFIGNDPKKWRTGVKSFSKVRYRSVYPGIDLVYHSDRRKLEYDLIVAPRANPAAITVAFTGPQRMRIDKNGDLVLKTSVGEVRQQKPKVFQEVLGAKKQIAARFVWKAREKIGFKISRYDRRRPLVIDPVLLYSTYLGGSALDSARAVAVDASGNVYITGSTSSINFPTANPFQASRGGFPNTTDAFVTKLNPTGTALVYSTYLGGSNSDSGFGIALDSMGNPYVTGETSSLNFPTANALQVEVGGLIDAFIAKLSPEGSMLVYSSYFGGSFNESARGIAVDALGSAYITGSTQSPDFPLANALRSTIGQQDAFVSKFNSAGTALVYSTYLGGSGTDSATAIALDSVDNAYVTGSTRSADFPTINALQSTFSDKTLLKSTDSGASWTLINNGVPRNQSVLALAIDPLNTTTLYAGTLAGIYKSTDGGGQWVQATQGLADPSAITALSVDPVNPSILYAASSRNVYKSINGGASWDNILDTFLNTSLVIDPANHSTVYVGNSIQGVLVTTDGGKSWEDLGVPFANSRVISLAMDPTHPGSFYAGTELFGIHRFPAPCANLPAIGQRVSCVTVSPASPSTVYLGTGGLIYKTTDAGLTWKPADSGLGDLAIAVDPITPQTVYAGSTFQCLKSTDGGDSWSTLAVNPQSTTIPVNEIVIDPANPSTLYAAATAGGEAFVTKLNASGGAYVYSTLLGGSGGDSGAAIAVDSLGSVYIAGTTGSLSIPSANTLRSYGGGLSDLMILKITPDGGAMSFFTYFGGVFQETAAAISIDSSGSVWITGNTNSPDLPTTPDATPVSSPCESGSCRHAFVSKFSSDGTLLAYSSYLGGNEHAPSASAGGGLGFGVAVDLDGSAYVVGQTFALDFPTTPGAFQVNSGGGTSDAFVTKIGSPCGFSLSRTSQAFPSAGGTGSVGLTTALGCAWTVLSQEPWIDITSANSGLGSADVTFEVSANPSERFRIATLTIGGQALTILQEGLGSSACIGNLFPTSESFSSNGGSSSVKVVANEDCIWTAISNSNWITVASNDNGIGVGTVSYSVDANPDPTARSGSITIAGRTFVVKQKGNVGNRRSGAHKPF